MKLKTAKIIVIVGGVLMVLALLLYVSMEKKVYGYVGAALAFASAIFWLMFGRCPACGRYLGGLGWGKYCPYCGEKLEE